MNASTSTALPLEAPVRGRQGGFVHDLLAIASRALRQVTRDPESVLPAVIIPIFFYVVDIGALQHVTHAQTGVDYRAFLLPASIIFGVTGISRASALVTDIQGGYFDRLCTTPVHRLALLYGLMVADFTLVIVVTLPVLALGFALGVRFATGVAGVLAFLVIGALWGVVFTGFPYAIALKTGNPAAVNASFVMFFPFIFLTDGIVPKAALTGWLAAIATYNPITYLLGALRALISNGWDASAIGDGLLAIGCVGLLSMGLALITLRGRVRRGA